MRPFSYRGLWLLAGLLVAVPPAYSAEDKASDPLLRRGEYVYQAAGCYGCHTDDRHGGTPLAGGRALATAFGTFYSPNITPDTETGIGKWTEQDFVRALRLGLGRNGEQLYPAFPYASYTRMTDADLHALWLYLQSRPAVRQANKAHDLKWYVGVRPLIGIWKALYFIPGAYAPDPRKSLAWNRGAYLVEALTHCGECHTPRNALGGPRAGMRYAGTQAGPEGSVVPNITPDGKTGIGKWSAGDLITYLGNGMTPDGDFAGDLMAEVIDNGLRHLTKEDLADIAGYIQSQPAVEQAVHKAAKKSSRKESWE
jgi:mono/diheme cytochrome c family protein